jgi:uncharacterized protein (DUF697 family)/uncharacterized tellurite resistance protein B-like protein
MQATEQRSLLTIALFASFADGDKADAEREEIKRIADSLAGQSGAPELSHLYQDVLLRRVTLADCAAGLADTGQKQLAYEMAVCVCDADGAQSPAEREFLQTLKATLGLDGSGTVEAEQAADAIAALPIGAVTVAAGASNGASTPVEAQPARSTTAVSKLSDEELDKSILNHAILNGALELLPQSWASMAIIPLQMKMVYRIGQAHGFELDKGHIKEFVAAAGVGLTSQYLEQFGRKLLGGLLGKVGGGLGRTLGGAAAGIAFSFASTYALGQLARRYYAGGRQMDTAVLKDTYQSLLAPAKDLQTRYLPQIQQKAQTLDAGQIMQLGKSA